MSRPERYEPRARSIGGAWKMVKCKDGPYVCFEQHEEIVAVLAAENERLRSASFVTAVPSEEYEKLKAENERLRKDIMEISNAAKMVSVIGIKAADELTMLKDQNERLLKAGDEMRNWIISEGYDLHCVDDWNAAKEGGAK